MTTHVEHSRGLLPRLCVYCGKFTRQRVTHYDSFITDFCDHHMITSRKPAHRDCHTKHCKGSGCVASV
ncbi:MAG: hypothetical protein Q8Q39_05110 [bacterium]|nr:hypothetical protein [bacterium]